MMDIAKLLAAVPLPADDAAAETWASGQAASLANTVFDAVRAQDFIGVTGREVMTRTPACMRHFSLAALAADFACYAAATDRADYARLRAVMETFPDGFRVWMARTAHGIFVPAGYTGWYPIDTAVFEKAYAAPASLTHRRALWPRPHLAATGDYIWLFNYCIVAPLRRTAQSRRLLGAYAADLRAISLLGMAAAVLSPESKAVVQRFGMTFRGDMTHDGVRENVYAMRASGGPAPKAHPTQTPEPV